MYDIAVIGAGVVGGLIARTLAKYDAKICVLEKENDVAMGASRANSGIIHAGFDAECGTLKAKLNVEGSEMMERIANELGVRYRRNGALVVAFEDEKDEIQKLYDRGIANGVKGLSIIGKEELHTLEPSVNPDIYCALRAQTSAIICPYGLTLAAIGNAMDNGTELKLNFAVSGIEKKDGGYVIKAEDGREIEAKYIINSAGVYADIIARLTGDCDFTVTPRRGEYMLLDKECGTLTSHTIFHTPTKMGKGILVSPTADGNLLLGPTAVNSDDKEDNTTTPAGFDTIRQKAVDNVVGIPFGKMITSFCGIRAVGSTGDFIIRMRDGIVTLAGIESPGLSSAPAIALYVENLLKDAGFAAELKKNYNPKRRAEHWFRDMTPAEKNEVIRREPAYGRIICRCEGISEGEIIEAIHTNPGAVDLDGIKRRTRSGMGRCQGGFCSPNVVGILARETGVPFEAVTKSGKGSIINYGKTKGEI